MRIFLAAAAALACLAMPAVLLTPAMAQKGRHKSSDEKPAANAAAKIDEKAYQAALSRIPEPKQKYDPWGGVVPPQTNKKP